MTPVVEFGIPPGWRKPVGDEARSSLGSVLAVRPDAEAGIVVASGFRTDNATLADIADQFVAAVRTAGVDVEVLRRAEMAAGAAEGFAQLVKLRDGSGIVQCHAFLAVPDAYDERTRTVLRVVLSTTVPHLAVVAADFQEFLGGIRAAVRADPAGDGREGERAVALSTWPAWSGPR
ncbi:hypothetical protein [Amycolatopsis albispora]|nr:hypothetical protein [Amycolatopsis albispora]